MIRKSLVLSCVVLGLAWFVSGCVTTQQFVSASTGPVAAGMARIEVTRKSQVSGAACPIVISDGTTRIGEVGPGGRLVWDRPAGVMELTPFNDDPAFLVGRGTPLRIGVAEGVTYSFNVQIGFLNFVPKLELISGATVAIAEGMSNAPSTAVEIAGQAAPLATAAGEVRTFTGRIMKTLPAKASPPKWPYAWFVATADDGSGIEVFVLRATVYTDTTGKSFQNRFPKKGRKTEVRYTTTGDGRNEAVTIRYLD